MMTGYEKAAAAAKEQRFILRATVSNAVEIIELEDVTTELLTFADFLLYIDTVSEHDIIETSATPDELRMLAAQYVVRDSTTTRAKNSAAERKGALSRACDHMTQARAALEMYHRQGGNFKAVTITETLKNDLKEIQKWRD